MSTPVLCPFVVVPALGAPPSLLPWRKKKERIGMMPKEMLTRTTNRRIAPRADRAILPSLFRVFSGFRGSFSLPITTPAAYIASAPNQNAHRTAKTLIERLKTHTYG